MRDDHHVNTATATSAVGEKKPATEANGQKNEGTLFICSAELFPGHGQLHNPDMFRGVITGCTPEFKDLVKWLVAAKDSQDQLIIGDGRSEVARKQIRDLLTGSVADPFIELWVIYDMETSLHLDVRNPKRKLAWSGANMETLFLILPTKNKGQRNLDARDLFNKSGESTNFSRSYSGVPFRNLVEIPRLTSEGKRSILSISAVGEFSKIRVQKEITEKGHPLLWGEWKPVTF